jgi:hypothetical protein
LNQSLFGPKPIVERLKSDFLKNNKLADLTFHHTSRQVDGYLNELSRRSTIFLSNTK